MRIWNRGTHLLFQMDALLGSYLQALLQHQLDTAHFVFSSAAASMDSMETWEIWTRSTRNSKGSCQKAPEGTRGPQDGDLPVGFPFNHQEKGCPQKHGLPCAFHNIVYFPPVVLKGIYFTTGKGTCKQMKVGSPIKRF